MTMRHWTLFTVALLATVASESAPTYALTMKECSAKYKAAQTAGTLKGQKWNDFRKAECGADAAATPSATPAAAPAPTLKPATAPAPTPVAAPPTGNAIFPNAVDQKYSKESAGKARMHTCLDQYNTNKTGTDDGGLK